MDTELKKRLKGFRETPDWEVWNRVERSLRRRSFAKGVAALVGGMAVIAAIVFSIVEQQPQGEGRMEAKGLVDSVKKRETLQKDTVAVVREEGKGESLPMTAEPRTKSADDKVSVEEMDMDMEVEEEATVVTGEVAAAWCEPSASTSTTVDTVKGGVQSFPEHEKHERDELGHDSVHHGSKSNNYTEEGDALVRMPNVILPNDDNAVNRVFRVYANGTLSMFRLCIYNRRGSLVFETTDIDSAWDATYNGTPVAGGTYVYVVQYGDMAGRKHVEKGAVSVIR